ncbi:MAG: CinA family protein [Acetobacter sp.]|nr:CinA family protein [Acetobacter sp.]
MPHKTLWQFSDLPPDWTTLQHEAQQLINFMRIRGTRLITAESCTGGMLATLFTDLPGSSHVIEGGFVTYSNAMKHATLGVKNTTLQRYGAVSAQTVQEMAEGALRASEHATIAVAISGIAGPDGGTAEKPVGLVWFGTALRHGITETDYQIFHGKRTDIRTQATYHAIKLIAFALHL